MLLRDRFNIRARHVVTGRAFAKRKSLSDTAAAVVVEPRILSDDQLASDGLPAEFEFERVVVARTVLYRHGTQAMARFICR